MMKINGFNMLVENGEFIDLLFQAEITKEEGLNLGLKYCDNGMVTLSLIFDKLGDHLITGIMDGIDIVEIPLHDEEITQIKSVIENSDISELEEVFKAMVS